MICHFAKTLTVGYASFTGTSTLITRVSLLSFGILEPFTEQSNPWVHASTFGRENGAHICFMIPLNMCYKGRKMDKLQIGWLKLKVLKREITGI